MPYLVSIRALPRIDSPELKETLAIYRLTKSITARNKIIEHYLPLIPQIITRYAGQGIGIDDLIQEANLKLVEIITVLPDTEVTDLTALIVASINNTVLNSLKSTRYRK